MDRKFCHLQCPWIGCRSGKQETLSRMVIFLFLFSKSISTAIISRSLTALSCVRKSVETATFFSSDWQSKLWMPNALSFSGAVCFRFNQSFFFFFLRGGPFRQLFQCETTLPTSINIHIVKVKLHRWLPQIHTLYQHIITSSVGLANCCRHMILSISTRKRKRGSPTLSQQSATRFGRQENGQPHGPSP